MTTTHAYAVLALVTIIWAGNFPMAKAGLGELGPLTLTATRALLTAPVLLAVVRAMYGPFPVLSRRDYFTFTVISQLEDLGFCAKGEGGPWVEGGRIELGGELPVNTSGGHLSEGYVRSMNLVNEAVRQLRHEYAGTPRQVADAKLGVVTSAPNPGSAIVLGRN